MLYIIIYKWDVAIVVPAPVVSRAVAKAMVGAVVADATD